MADVRANMAAVTFVSKCFSASRAIRFLKIGAYMLSKGLAYLLLNVLVLTMSRPRAASNHGQNFAWPNL